MDHCSCLRRVSVCSPLRSSWRVDGWEDCCWWGHGTSGDGWTALSLTVERIIVVGRSRICFHPSHCADTHTEIVSERDKERESEKVSERVIECVCERERERERERDITHVSEYLAILLTVNTIEIS